MRTCEEMDAHLFFHGDTDIIACQLTDGEECYFMIFNHRTEERTVSLPQGVFYKRLGEECRPDYLNKYENTVTVPPISCTVYKRL